MTQALSYRSVVPSHYPVVRRLKVLSPMSSRPDDEMETQKGEPRLVGPEGGHQKEVPRRLEQFADDPGDEGKRGKQVRQTEVPRATEGVEFFRGRR